MNELKSVWAQLGPLPDGRPRAGWPVFLEVSGELSVTAGTDRDVAWVNTATLAAGFTDANGHVDFVVRGVGASPAVKAAWFEIRSLPDVDYRGWKPQDPRNPKPADRTYVAPECDAVELALDGLFERPGQTGPGDACTGAAFVDVHTYDEGVAPPPANDPKLDVPDFTKAVLDATK